MHELNLTANFSAWKIFSARKSKPDFLRFSEKVLARDNFTCQFCGFQAKEYQEVVDIEQNYQQLKISSAATACCFCTQCFFLESVGVGTFGGGSLIYLPEVSQANLNSFCHVIFCAISNDTGYRATAESIYRSLKFRTQQIEEQFGEGTSEPSIFGRLLIDSDSLRNEDLKTAIKNNIRLLPSRAKFKVQIDHWAEAALNELSTEEFAD